MATIRYVTPPVKHEDKLIEGENGESFYIKVFGGLTTEESQTASLLLIEDTNAFDFAASLSETIGLAEGLTQVEAYAICERATGDEAIPADRGEDVKEKELSIRLKYNEEIKELKLLWSKAGQRGTEATITAMAKNRIQYDGEWTLTDTRKLPAAIYRQLIALLNEEQKLYQKTIEPPTEDELKKQQDKEPPSEKSTGPKSSTNSATPSPAAIEEKPSTKK